MPYNSSTSAYERRAATVIDATPDGDTVAVAIDVKLDQGIDDYVADLNHHNANGNHYPATSVGSDSRFLKQSPAGVVSWAEGVVAANAALKDFSNVANGAISNEKLAAIAPTKITQNASNRFVTDAEKSTWNGALYDKADVEGVLTGTITTHTHSAATSTAKGLVELATTAEAAAGTDTSRAVTAAGVAAYKPLSMAKFMHVRDQKASGTAGGSASAATWHTRDINTVVTNTITGASVASNRVTLPTGEYYIRAKGPSYNCQHSRLKLYNHSDSTDTLIGNNNFTTNGNFVEVYSEVVGIFAIAAQKTFEIRQYTSHAQATSGLGLASGISGISEIYTEVEIWKIA